MNQFTGISLKTRLYLVVLAAFIPVAILIVYVAEEQKAIETDAILSRTRTLAQAAANVESLQVEAIRDLMIAVAEAYREVDDQPALLAGLLTRLTGHAERYAVFGILDPAGHLIAGSDPAQMASDYGGRGWLSDSLAQKSLLMAPYHGERIDGEPVVYFVQPIAENGRTVVAVAFAALNLNLMNRSIFRQLTELPAGARLNLVDPDGVLLSYDVDAHRWTDPPPLGPELRRRITAQAAGRLVAADANGQSPIYAFARLESALRQRPATVVLEIPLKVALAASQRIFRRNLMLLAISALMAVTAIWWAADRFILRRVGKMVRASRRLAAGDLRARIGPLGIRDELSHLAGVFDEMAAALQVRIEREAQVMASLRRSREQLRRLTAYQNDVREQERIRIAREIHDQLGQSLTILKMDLAWMKKHMATPDSAVVEKMDAMARLIKEAMDELHAVTAELRPVILDDFGLAAAIEWQAEMFRRRSGIGCRFENDGFEPVLPKSQATALFRIFQELLTNIMRHAEADSVIVRLARRENELLLQVADDGRGVTEDEINSPQAFGVLGIRERLHPLDGRVVFEGRPGQGTRVTVYMPLKEEGGSP